MSSFETPRDLSSSDSPVGAIVVPRSSGLSKSEFMARVMSQLSDEQLADVKIVGHGVAPKFWQIMREMNFYCDETTGRVSRSPLKPIE
jgi:hypothetical protein